MAGRRTGTAGRRTGAVPYTQGDLDGLCGVYVVVNAAHVLAPGLTRDEAERLFQALLKALRPHDTGPVPLAAAGLSRRRLNLTILNARQFLGRLGRGRLDVWPLPHGLEDRWSLAALWRVLGERLSPTCVAIIGLDGIHDHWTLAVAVTPRTIRLFDSGGLKVLRRRNCPPGSVEPAAGTLSIRAMSFSCVGSRRNREPPSFQLSDHD